MSKFLAYIMGGELFDAKYALLQFAGVTSDERHPVVIESEAEMADVRAGGPRQDRQGLSTDRAWPG